MAPTTMVAIYFLIWWVVLFAVLPWGVRAQGESAAPGTDPGAPIVTNMKSKLLWTTLVSTVIFVIFWIVYSRKLLTLEDLATLFGLLR